MKRIYVGVVFILSLFSSCEKEDDKSLNEVCTSGCTIVSGRFTTETNKPIVGIPINIRFESKPMLGIGQTKIRQISSTTTDSDGNYSLKFKVKENEYSGGTGYINGSILLKFGYNKSDYSNITQYDYFGAEEGIFLNSKPDTSITMNFYLPKRAKINIKLKKFSPLQSNDHFSVLIGCAAGANNKQSSTIAIEATGPLIEQELNACGNQFTSLLVRKRKNGILTLKDTSVYTPIGQIPNVEFNY